MDSANERETERWSDGGREELSLYRIQETWSVQGELRGGFSLPSNRKKHVKEDQGLHGESWVRAFKTFVLT